MNKSVTTIRLWGNNFGHGASNAFGAIMGDNPGRFDADFTARLPARLYYYSPLLIASIIRLFQPPLSFASIIGLYYYSPQTLRYRCVARPCLSPWSPAVSGALSPKL